MDNIGFKKCTLNKNIAVSIGSNQYSKNPTATFSRRGFSTSAYPIPVGNGTTTENITVSFPGLDKEDVTKSVTIYHETPWYGVTLLTDNGVITRTNWPGYSAAKYDHAEALILSKLDNTVSWTSKTAFLNAVSSPYPFLHRDEKPRTTGVHTAGWLQDHAQQLGVRPSTGSGPFPIDRLLDKGGRTTERDASDI